MTGARRLNGNRLPAGGLGADVPLTQAVTMLSDAHVDPLFDAAVESTEEAIDIALVTAGTMTGRDGVVAHALPHGLLLAALDRHGLRLPD